MKSNKTVIIIFSSLMIFFIFIFSKDIENKYFTIINLIKKNNLRNLEQLEDVRGWYFLIEGESNYILQIKGQPSEMIFVTNLEYNFFDATHIQDIAVVNNHLRYDNQSIEVDNSRYDIEIKSNSHQDIFCISEKNDSKYNGCIVISNEIIGNDNIKSIVYIK